MKTLFIPSNALVMTVGPAASGKSTFVRGNFSQTERVSSDECRRLVSDDIENQRCNRQAFDVLHTIIEARLELGKLTVADATNLKASSRSKLFEVAEKHKVPVVGLRFFTDPKTSVDWNNRRDRNVPEWVIEKHHREFDEAVSEMDNEPFHLTYDIFPEKELYRAKIVGTGVIMEDRIEKVPGVDVIGDVHGCAPELVSLVAKLGYKFDMNTEDFECRKIYHPEGRKLVLVGDLTDRGPYNRASLHLAQEIVSGGGEVVMGNHCNKLWRALKGNPVKMAHGLTGTWEELEQLSVEEREEFRDFLGERPHHVVIPVADVEDLVVCHAGMPRDMVGRDDKRVLSHCLYGQVQGFDPSGLPIRGEEWVKTWTPDGPWLVHGHTVVESPTTYLGSQVINIDTGAVFGGKLTAFRYPEMTFESVPAGRDYAAEGKDNS